MTSAFTPHPEMLRIHDLHAFYGESHILHGIDFNIREGEGIALMGRNGMGKSTLIKSMLGLVRPRHGRVLVRGDDYTKARTYQTAQQGIAYVPEGRGIFKSLTVRGFLQNEFVERLEPTFLKEAAGWIKDGSLRYREDIVEGLDKAPEAFIGLLDGKNFGKLVVRVAE